MNCRDQSFAQRFAIFAGIGLLMAGLVAGAGFWIVGGVRESVLAVVVGCGASWIASCAGAVPLSWAMCTAPEKAANALLASTALRFLVVLALAAPLLLGGWFPVKVLAVALGASYLLILTVDCVIGLRMIRALGGETHA